MAPDEENILSIAKGRTWIGKGIIVLSGFIRSQRSVSAPELLNIPTATSNPIIEGAMDNTVESPCSAPFKNNSNTGFF